MKFQGNSYWLLAVVAFGFLSGLLVSNYFSPIQEQTSATKFDLAVKKTPLISPPVDMVEEKTKGATLEQDLSIRLMNNDEPEASPLIHIDSPDTPVTVGEFIDIDQVLAAESKKPPRSVGKFIDVNQYLKPDRASTSNEVIESGQFKDVNQFHPKASNEVVNIGERMDVDSGMIPDSQSRVVNMGEFIPVKD